ncbi:hypothetical protein KPL47_06805 [Clostridium estertheticum]|uniref:hypothetical protein n=1 Tax=Clostridium estertheticum TaxID=238834 RepID=UPI001C0E52EE|nr:hypothetical protein [Clostridium estertheticum]MBU3176076.1 hypothetical protein [Clostridium estertheticum]
MEISISLNSEFNDMNEFLKDVMPKYENENRWNCFYLAEKNKSGSDNVLINSNSIEAITYLGAK